MRNLPAATVALSRPSMKVPPKRKGNRYSRPTSLGQYRPLNESPSEKEGKSGADGGATGRFHALNESPSEKEGKCRRRDVCTPP